VRIFWQKIDLSLGNLTTLFQLQMLHDVKLRGKTMNGQQVKNWRR